MNSFGIWGVSQQTRMRMRLLSVGKRISMGELLTQLVNREWEKGETLSTREFKRKARRLLRKYEGEI